MKTWVRRSLNAGALAAGALLVAGAPAHADAISAGNTGVLNGTQILAPIQIPVNVCGIAAGVVGDATASCAGGAAATLNPEWTTLVSYGNTGILNGTQVYAPIQAPVNVCGIAASVAGDATASCTGGAKANKPGHKPYGARESVSGKHRKPHGHDRWLVTHSNVGIANGTQVYAPIQIPINICGIAIGVLGDATASCRGGATAILH